MKQFRVFALLALAFSLCSCKIFVLTNNRLNNDLSVTRSDKKLAINIDVSKVENPFSRRPNGFVGSAMRFEFALADAIKGKVRDGLKQAFTVVPESKENQQVDIKVEKADMIFECSGAVSEAFDKAAFTAVVSVKVGEIFKKDYDITAMKEVTDLGGDRFLIDKAIDAGVEDFILRLVKDLNPVLSN